MLSRDFPVKDICEIMGVSRSGYYKWLRRDPSDRDINREAIVEVVEEVHSEFPSHGYRWVAAYIRNSLRTKGVYVWADNFDFEKGEAEVHVEAETLQAMTKPMITHRCKEYKQLHGAIVEKLRKALQTDDDIFLVGCVHEGDPFLAAC